jgi:Tol biopolymer transport system component
MEFANYAALLLLLGSPAVAQETVLVDEALGGGTPSAGANVPSVSLDGRYVSFQSTDDSLVLGDVNGFEDVFLRDLQTGVTELVSVATSGAGGDGASNVARMSPDARFVAFASTAKTIATPPQVGNARDIFLRDRTAGTTTLISVSTGGGEANGASFLPDVSDDGNRVVFESSASNLVAEDGNGKTDVFLRDLALGKTFMLSLSTSGTGGNQASRNAVISADGDFVVFDSNATDLVAGDTNNKRDVFVFDVNAATLERVSLGPGGVEGDKDSRFPDISADGNLALFVSSATNLIVGDTNGWQDIFVRDRAAGITELVSKSAAGSLANYSSFGAQLSDDGRYVAISTGATNLTVPPTPKLVGMVRVDRATGQVDPTALSHCNLPLLVIPVTEAISADGSAVAFASESAHAVAGDVNGTLDVFLHDLDALSTTPPCTFCVIAPTSNGCLPSISAVGTASASASSGFVLTVSSVEGKRNALFVNGVASVTTPWGVGGPSYLCVGNSGRFGGQNSGGTAGQCDGILTVDWNAEGSAFSLGSVGMVQAWFRDPASQKKTHLSDAIAFFVGL